MGSLKAVVGWSWVRWLWVLMCVAVVGCTPIEGHRKSVVIMDRDLVEQSKTGNGEGLAKGVPGQPLLVNNPLIFSTMGDAVLGIAIATGAIKKTLAMFSPMQPLLAVQWTQAEIDKQSKDQRWLQVLARLSASEQTLLIEPYCYLDGYPNAALHTRLRVSVLNREQVLWSEQLVESSAQLPLSGEKSWSHDQGRRVIDFTQSALPKLVARLPELMSERGVSSPSTDHK